ncbi:LOW QUALITY PROTEIN: pectinesterase-like protein [Cinnamomum micranthum f. kanehirae]|uniref:Pectinesterase-like protein n=1 Tax=Cinnamomum micranthum f. kanehirae TaxID=337451 RepID=A0A443PJ82_9MAGN|nr:LOW QUALITY PROTEIN: pectinesterase-like protein [Cinnamomum micranthum f. kanehirae]
MNEDDAINFVVLNFISGDSGLLATEIPFERRGILGRFFKITKKKSSYMALKSYRLFSLSIDIAIVNSIVKRESVVVDQHGLGNFTTIRKALAMVPNETEVKDVFFPNTRKRRHLRGIRIRCVQQKEYYDHWRREEYHNYYRKSQLGTYIYILYVKGEHFIAINMTFRNIAKAAKGQALAIQNNANLSAFKKQFFEGFHDTLCASSGSQFYKNCDIYGTIDFIFWYADVVFQTCNIYVRLPLQGQSNVITAHNRGATNESTGYSIQHCKISASPDFGI